MHGVVVRRVIGIRGIVQGVGFRPFVHGLAHELVLAGSIRNVGGGVRIEIQGAAEAVETFTRRVRVEAPPLREGRPSFEQLMARVQAYGIVPERYQAYADRRWGRGWKINPNGRAQAWNELERYGNDPQGYLDKIESEMQLASRGRTA